MSRLNETYQNLDYLVETEWLQQHLNDPELRIFDCAAYPSANLDPKTRKKFPLLPQSGRNQYDDGHIPGAGFIDVPYELSDPLSMLPVMSPPEHHFVVSMKKYGINNDSQVILYSKSSPIWAARVWWMLRSFGFDNVVILNGGWSKWIQEERPTSTEPSTYTSGNFNAKSRPELFVDKNQVLAAIDDNDVCLIHALPQATYTGASDIVFGRRGHIPNSINIPAESLHDPETHCYLSTEQLEDLFSAADKNKIQKIITYCGGGINASNDAFVLTMLGYENVAVYDGSMNEWGNDSSLPIEIS